MLSISMKGSTMAALRMGEEGFNAWIYFCDVGLSITAPSFTGVVKDLDMAKVIIDVLLTKKEVPDDIMQRIYKEAWQIATP